MAQEIDVKALKQKRRAKKRRKMVKQIIAVLIIIFIGAVIYYTRERWLPFFDGIATRYLPVVKNDGTLAVGNFPLKIYNSENCQLGTMENSFAVLDDTNLFVYTTDGENIVDKQHEYSTPILETNDKKALIYDMGGMKFRLESKYKTLYKKNTDDAIIFAKLSDNDNVAVVTKSDKFVSIMIIYDSSGEEIFRWKSFDSRVIDVTFTSSNDGCIVSTIDASGGQLISRLHRFNFDKEKEIWVSQDIDTMIISTQNYDDGTIVAFGDTKCAYYTVNGEYIGSYQYKSNLIDYDCSGSMSALLFENEERRKSGLVLIDNIKSGIKEIAITGEAKHVIAEGGNSFLMTGNKIDEYSVNGTMKKSVLIGNEYTDFHKLGKYIFLLGYSDINRIDFIE